jgi:hypothetical protein
MTTVAQAARNTGLQPKLINSVIRQLGGRDSLQDIANHGIDGGFHGFIYYTETFAFWKRNRGLIADLAREQASEFGTDAVSMIAGFNCLKNDDDAQLRDSIGRAIYGGRMSQNNDCDSLVANALAWYAAEEVARAMCEE